MWQASGLSGEHMLRQEAIALLKELGNNNLVQPLFVIIEKRTPDKFQLKIKGYYDSKEIEIFLKNSGYSFQDNHEFLIIF